MYFVFLFVERRLFVPIADKSLHLCTYSYIYTRFHLYFSFCLLSLHLYLSLSLSYVSAAIPPRWTIISSAVATLLQRHAGGRNVFIVYINLYTSEYLGSPYIPVCLSVPIFRLSERCFQSILYDFNAVVTPRR